MKKNKFIFLSLVACLGIGMVSCNPTDPSETTSAPTETEPTTNSTDDMTPPSYDEDAVWFHYHRPDGKYDGWGLWLWEVSADESQHYPFDEFFLFNGQDDYGAICAQPISLWNDLTINKIGVIVRDENWNKDPDGDRFITLSDFTKDENGIYHIYLVSEDSTIYSDPSAKDIDSFSSAAFISTKRIVVKTNHEISEFKFFENDVLLKEKVIDEKESVKMADINLEEEGNFDSVYTCEVKFKASGRVLTTGITTQPLFKSKKFDETYTYDGELGAIYSKESTTFKVWSPVSTEILLNIYETGTTVATDPVNGSDEKTTYNMEKGEKGVFSITVDGDLNGKYYTYTVTNPTFNKKEIVDPYAQSAGVNGRRGMIVDFNDPRALPEGWNDSNWEIHPRTEMTVWETHVSDVTSSSTWIGNENNRLLFNGVIEKGTTYTENGITVKTGYDHIKELGVNTVQFVPVYDQDNIENIPSFNWGYNPLNYNVIEGQYSSDPYDGFVRIKEFRNLVKTFNDDGINVIMDVVYNHVSSLEKSNFNVLMPGYYFRYSGTKPTSGSGCGNDTASELPMMSKFIVDSTEFLAKTYKLSGYRFDLMGLHDVNTMNKVVANLRANYNEDIVVYGEPRTMSTGTTVTLANQKSMKNWVGFGGFNDYMRDAIKGSVFDATGRGWATDSKGMSNASYDNIVSSLLGKTPSCTSDPKMNVAYVSCHDNNTIFDKMKLSLLDNEGNHIFSNSNPIPESEMNEEHLKMSANYSVFANSFVFSAEGTSFMNAGEELCRSKFNEDHTLNENSYNATYKCNELDYSRKIKYADIFTQYQMLIDLKQDNAAFHYDTANDVENNVTVNETQDKTYIDISYKNANKEIRIIFASASYAQDQLASDLAGYTFVSSIGNSFSTSGFDYSKDAVKPGTAYIFSK